MYVCIHICKHVRDNNLYTTTNKCSQCLLEVIYTVFKTIGVYV